MLTHLLKSSISLSVSSISAISTFSFGMKISSGQKKEKKSYLKWDTCHLVGRWGERVMTRVSKYYLGGLQGWWESLIDLRIMLQCIKREVSVNYSFFWQYCDRFTWGIVYNDWLIIVYEKNINNHRFTGNLLGVQFDDGIKHPLKCFMSTVLSFHVINHKAFISVQLIKLFSTCCAGMNIKKYLYVYWTKL